MNPSETQIRDVRQLYAEDHKSKKQQNPWTKFIRTLLKQKGFESSSAIRRWCSENITSELKDFINTLYVQSLNQSLGEDAPTITDAQLLCGKNPSHASRTETDATAYEKQNWHLVSTMDPFFSLAIVKGLDVRDFAPRYATVLEDSLLAAIRMVQQAWYPSPPATVTLSEVEVGLFFIQFGAEALIPALMSSDVEVCRKAVLEVIDQQRRLFLQVQPHLQRVPRATEIALYYCIPLALLQESDFEELIDGRLWPSDPEDD